MQAERPSRADFRSQELIGHVARLLVEGGSVDSASTPVLAAVSAEMGNDRAGMWRVSRASGRARLIGLWREDCHPGSYEDGLGSPIEPGTGHVGRAIEERSWVWDDGPGSHQSGMCPVGAPSVLGAALAFPCKHSSELVAVFCLHWAGPAASRDLSALEGVADQLARFEARSRHEVQVRRSEARKAAMLESALDAVITVDHHGRIVEFNPAAVRTFGWRPEQAIGRVAGDLLVPESRKEGFGELVRRVATLDQSAGIRGERVEGRALRKSGEEFPVEVTVTRVDAWGPPTFVAYLRDLSAEKKAESERERLLEAERSARMSAEEARARMSFLARAGRLLSSSLDLEETLRKVAGLVVPGLADWCAIDLLQPDGEIQSVAIEHPDPTELAWARQVRKSYPPSLSDTEGVARVITTGEPVLAETIDEAQLDLVARDSRHLEELRRLAPASAMIVPLTARKGAIGAITMISTLARRPFGPEDLELAEELARHAGLAIDNARLYAEKSHIATILQRGLLPPRLLEVPGLQLAARYRPGGSGYDVGGDFYDVFTLEDGRCFLAVGDVEGKGPEAASSTGLVRNTLRATARYEEDPRRLLGVVNKAMLENDSGLLCTLGLALLTLQNGGCVADIARGGHPTPVLLRANGVIEAVGRVGTVLGVFDDPLAVATRHHLAEGDVLLMFSDGLLGRGSEPVDLLRSCSLDPGWDADSISDAMLAAAPEGESADDVCLLVAKVVAKS